MSMENFRERMLSNEHEQDHDFIPSDNVWTSIAEELGEKKDRRKPFILFLFGFAFLVVLGSMFIQAYSKNQRPNEPIQSSVNTEAINTVENKHGELKENHLTNSVSHTNATISDKSDALGNQLKAENSPHVGTISNFDLANSESQTSSNVGENQNQLNPFGKYHPGAKSEFANLTSSVIKLNDDNELSESLNESSKSQKKNSFAIDKVSGETLNKEASSIKYRDDKNIDKIPLLHPYLFSTKLHDVINPPFVKVDKFSSTKDWTVGLYTYGSISNYSIANFSGFEQIDFALNGKPSIGYQFTVEKNIAKSLSLYAGIGIDHSHFDADYLLTIDQSELNFVQGLGSNTATLVKSIPSLAGGLEASFIFDDLPSNIRTSTVNLNLAHDFKTITIPFGARLAVFKTSPISAVVSVGMEYRRRVLTIDTGVNALTSDNSEIELTTVSPVDNATQPFRINNFNAVTSVSVDYSISSKVNVGLETGFVKPILSVYNDANYSVNTFQFRTGVFINYNF